MASWRATALSTLEALKTNLAGAVDNITSIREREQKAEDWRNVHDVARVENDVLMTKIFQMVLLLIQSKSDVDDAALPDAWRLFLKAAAVWAKRIDSADSLPLKVISKRIRRLVANESAAAQATAQTDCTSSSDVTQSSAKVEHKPAADLSAADREVYSVSAEVDMFVSKMEIPPDQPLTAEQQDVAVWEADHHPILDAIRALGSGVDRHRRDLDRLGSQVWMLKVVIYPLI